MDTRRQFSAGRKIPLISGFTVIETTNPRRGYTANVNRQTTDKLLFSHAIITDENM